MKLEPVELKWKNLVESFRLDSITPDEWKMIESLGLPGTEELSTGKDRSPEVISKFLKGLLGQSGTDNFVKAPTEPTVVNSESPETAAPNPNVASMDKKAEP